MCLAGFLILGIPLLGGDRNAQRRQEGEGPLRLRQPGVCYITGYICNQGMAASLWVVLGEHAGVDGYPTDHPSLVSCYPQCSSTPRDTAGLCRFSLLLGCQSLEEQRVDFNSTWAQLGFLAHISPSQEQPHCPVLWSLAKTPHQLYPAPMDPA